MKMSFRWYGSTYDTVSLENIRQIPGVKGVITTLHGKPQGEAWSYDEIKNMKDEVEFQGMRVDGIESIHVIDSIKVADNKRDYYINNYIKSLENLGKNNIHLVCYSFMPLFGWTRTTLQKLLPDGSNTMAYNYETIKNMTPDKMFYMMSSQSKGFRLPDWEPERLNKFTSLIKQYSGLTANQLFDNFVYFLKKIMPICDKYDINMALHPDDPAWGMFNIPRIVKNKEDICRILEAVDDPHNGLTLCVGSLKSNKENNIDEIVDAVHDRIKYVHLRNIKYTGYRSFYETSCLSEDGDIDMFDILKKLINYGFDGVVREDHGRNIWGEVAMPGYGLYDRALGTTYIEGLIEAINKNNSSGVN